MLSNCPICLELLLSDEVVVATRCGALFHEKCLTLSAQNEEQDIPLCPICYETMETSITFKHSVKLYFSPGDDDDDELSMAMGVAKKNSKLKDIIQKQIDLSAEIQSEMTKSRKPTIKKTKEIKKRVDEIATSRDREFL